LRPEHVLVATLAMSLFAFGAFGLDKRLAVRDRHRIPEARLLLLGFLLGWPGAWAGMSVFRHKTRKTGFRVLLAILSVLNPLWPLLWLSLR
jgi:uncharacterized membrane protein YsdA (DUF1294 family)